MRERNLIDRVRVALAALLLVGACASTAEPAPVVTATPPTSVGATATASGQIASASTGSTPSATSSATPSPTTSAAPPSVAPPSLEPSPSPSLSPGESPQGEPGTVRLMAVGDVMLAQTIGRRILRKGPLQPWRNVTQFFNQADLVVANLECTISDRGTKWPKTFTFRAPAPEAADSLVAAGVDVVSLANNHAIDYGIPAFEDTLDLLDARGIGRAGGGHDHDEAHAPLLVEQNGVRLAFLGYVLPFAGRPAFNTRQWAAGADKPGLALGTPDVVAREVAAVRDAVDVVVVMVHGGVEYTRSPGRAMRNFAAAAVGAGAKLVIGHHPHVLHGYRLEGQTLIAYSIGNFVFDYFTGRMNDTAIMDVTLSREGVESVAWIPAVIQNGFPRPAVGGEIGRIMGQLPEL